MDLSIRFKFFSGFMAILLFVGISMVVLNIQLLHVVRDNETVINQSVPKLVTQLQVKSSILERINFVTLYITTGREDFNQKFQQSCTHADKIEKDLLTGAAPGEKKQIEQFIQKSEDWEFILRDRVIPVYQLGNKEGAITILKSEVQPIAVELINRVEGLSQHKTEEINKTNNDSLQDAWYSVKLSYVVIAVTLILAVYFALYMSNTMTNPLVLVLTAVRKMAKGDFTARIPVQNRDAGGELGNAFNQMSRSINKLIEELKEANERLEEEMKRAQESTRLKSEFLANMSHELRTPLTGIIGFSELLLAESGGTLSAQQKDFAGNIILAGEHLLAMINDILDLSKIEAGKYVLEYGWFNMVDLVENTIKVVPAHQHDIAVYYSTEDSWKIKADAKRLKQVLFNLLSNAIKFSSPGTRIDITLTKNSKEMMGVTVADQGIGIEAEKLDKIFEQFYQNDGQLDRKYDGTGLGLTLSRQLIELHGGTIHVESTPGEGSSFTIFLPIDSGFMDQNIPIMPTSSYPSSVVLHLPTFSPHIACLKTHFQKNKIQPDIFVVESKEDAIGILQRNRYESVYFAGNNYNDMYLMMLETIREHKMGRLVACLAGSLRLVERGQVMRLADELIHVSSDETRK